MAAGMRHSVVVSSSNNVYAWGSNKFGQLGLDTPSGIVLPTLIPSREDGVIVGCDAGANHTALLTNQGVGITENLNSLSFYFVLYVYGKELTLGIGACQLHLDIFTPFICVTHMQLCRCLCVPPLFG